LLTATSQTDGFIEPTIGNLHFSEPLFDRISVVKSESVGHHAATQALVLSVAGVMAIALIASLILLLLR
jgi:hypothetical protein